MRKAKTKAYSSATSIYVTQDVALKVAESGKNVPTDIHNLLAKLSDNERLREADALEEFEIICRAFIEAALKDKANPFFVNLIRFALDHGLVTETELGKMGDTTRESANRWVNRKATTGLSNQRQVLRHLADLASTRAHELRTGETDNGA